MTLLGLLVCLLATAAARGQADARPSWRLGVFFWHDSPNDELAFAGMRAAFRIRDHKHEFLIERAHGDADSARRMITSLREREVDLIFAMGTEAALQAKRCVTDTPVVFTAVTHPVESGVVPGWGGSGSNLAGNSNWIDPATTLRAFRLAVPKLTRLGVLRSRDSGLVSGAELRDLRRHLDDRSLSRPDLEVIERIVADVSQIPQRVAELADAGVQAIWIPIDLTVYRSAAVVFAAARARHVPVVSTSVQAVQTGAVAGILPDYELCGQRAAVIALAILEGHARPASMPVGTLRSHRFVVNLDVARRSGFELPLSALVVADSILGGREREEDGRVRIR